MFPHVPPLVIRLLIPFVLAALLQSSRCGTRAECILEEVPMLLTLSSQSEGVRMPAKPTPPTTAAPATNTATTTDATTSSTATTTPPAGSSSSSSTTTDTSGAHAGGQPDQATGVVKDSKSTSPTGVTRRKGKRTRRDIGIDQHGGHPHEGLNDRVSVVMGGSEVFTFTNYNKTRRVYAQNTEKGDQLVFTFAADDGPSPSVSCPQIYGQHTFKLLQFHFHWGSTSKEGSEHLVDGKRFPMELHLIHINDNYTGIPDAMSRGAEPKGRYPAYPFLVIAVLFNVLPMPTGDSDSDSGDASNPDFGRLAKSLRCHNNSEPGVLHTDPKYGRLNLFNLIPGSALEYGTLQRIITYTGIRTLTATAGGGDEGGGCDVGGNGTISSAAWLVFKETLTISEGQLKQFRTLYNSEGNLVQAPQEAEAEEERVVEKLGERRSYLRSVYFEAPNLHEDSSQQSPHE